MNPTLSHRLAAYLAHLFTASGAIVALATAMAICRGDVRTALAWMILAVGIDAVDGPIARWIDVRAACKEIDGRTIDDLVDYLNYTFLPVLLIIRANWLPDPVWLWASAPLLTSLLGFSHTSAKDESAGFFRGFPSYWNIVSLYLAIWFGGLGQWGTLAVVLALSLLTVIPVRFVYPNRAPRWRSLFLIGSVAWAVVLVLMVVNYPRPPSSMVAVSLVYPAFYVGASVHLARH